MQTHHIKIFQGLILLLVSALMLSCIGNGSEEQKTPVVTVPLATVNFWNESSYKVDIYKNLNPQYFDITTFVCSVPSGSTVKATVPPSTDTLIGDTFYLRYKVQLADSFESGAAPIFVEAERTLSNISFVVESGASYTKTIAQPPASELRFANSYIAVQNLASMPVQIQRAGIILQKLNDGGVYLAAGQDTLGYYELPLSYLDAGASITQLKAFGSSYLDFPVFDIDRFNLFSFQVTNTGVTGPVISPLNKAQ